MFFLLREGMVELSCCVELCVMAAEGVGGRDALHAEVSLEVVDDAIRCGLPAFLDVHAKEAWLHEDERDLVVLFEAPVHARAGEEDPGTLASWREVLEVV